MNPIRRIKAYLDGLSAIGLIGYVVGLLNLAVVPLLEHHWPEHDGIVIGGVGILIGVLDPIGALMRRTRHKP